MVMFQGAASLETMLFLSFRKPSASLTSWMILFPTIYAQILHPFPLTGCPFTKPDVIFKLEQEEEPWVMEEEVLKKHCPG